MSQENKIKNINDFYRAIEELALTDKKYFIRNDKKKILDEECSMNYIHIGRRKSMGPLGRMDFWEKAIYPLFVELKDSLEEADNAYVKKYRNNFLTVKWLSKMKQDF